MPDQQERKETKNVFEDAQQIALDASTRGGEA
jgi:hypothetical protein